MFRSLIKTCYAYDQGIQHPAMLTAKDDNNKPHEEDVTIALLLVPDLTCIDP